MNQAREIIAIRYVLRRESFELDVDVEVARSGITGIYGESGSGKTTLLRCIAGLEANARGKLVIGGDVWEDSDAGISVAIHQRSIGYVFQEPRLFEHTTVEKNLRYGQRRGRGGNGEPEIGKVIELLNLTPLLGRPPRELSGGEAQRVAIGRALLRSPRLVLMDEPLAALDRARKDEILPFLERLHTELSLPILYVSHNIDEICRLCDQLIVLDNGSVVTAGEIQTVLVNLDIPALRDDEAGSVIEGRVEAYDAEYDLSSVQFSGGTLRVPGAFDTASPAVRLRIKANDVSLCRETPRQSTILNVLPVTIDEIRKDRGPNVVVRLRAGSDLLLAKVTRRSADDLALKHGDQLLAQIKSVAVRNPLSTY